MSKAETFELKKIRRGSVGRALDKARKYRDLNDPIQAESICLDILELEPDNEEARVQLILAMSERFAGKRNSPRKADIFAECDKLGDEYTRLYFKGLVTEREGLAYLERGHASVFAYEGLRDAMDLYEAAEKLSPEDNDDAVLRWNACVRAIRREKLKPPPHYKQELPAD